MKVLVICLVLIVAIAASPYGENTRQGSGQAGFGSSQGGLGGQGQGGFGRQGGGFTQGGRGGSSSGLGGGRGAGTFREGGIANSQGAGRHGNIGGYPGTHHGGYQTHGY